MRPRVVIVGAGFGGLRAARALRAAPVDVVLIDRRNYHLFQPLLYQVATAGLEPEQIARPVRAILRGQAHLTFRMAEVQGFDRQARVVQTQAGPIAYDFLILACGSVTNFLGLPGVAQDGYGLKDLDDAVGIRNHILRRFEEAAAESGPERRRQLLALVVAGGGPTGVEMAGALAELRRVLLDRDYPALDPDEVRVSLLEASERLLPTMPDRLAAAAAERLTQKGVEVRLGAAVDEYSRGVIRLRSGEQIPAATLIWAAGARASSLAAGLGTSLGPQGRVPVQPTLQLPGSPEVYVIGDAAYLETGGRGLPMMAPVAIQMAEAAAANILRQIGGRDPVDFLYRDPGSLATIGRNAAVAFIHGFSFTGFPAWVVWLVVHLIQLIGFRNRLFVLINWAWDYFLYDRAVRLITPD
ncbi:MAG: pyridine nucleotide-disulfide oxidoreductase [Chloroflexi bacterium RBG_13_68_17]|nr:MAG: pyridine nucleotide-disulfide oxidoreductase [Chloroflexi bacterium RBG_13_68_17]